MGNKKYVDFGETPKSYECTNKKCKWQGLKEEWVQKNTDPEFPSSTSATCPKCGNDEFYGLKYSNNTKDEIIKDAYGERWEENVRSDDGFLRYGGRQIDKENDFWECKEWLGYFFYRPISLKGIEDNNGWVKIENENDLPEEDCYCFLISKGKIVDDVVFFSKGSKYFVKGNASIHYEYYSHYRPIDKPQLPIY